MILNRPESIHLDLVKPWLDAMQPSACVIRKVKEDMTSREGAGTGDLPRQQKRELRLPPEILDIIKPALQVGGLSGMFNASITYFQSPLGASLVSSNLHVIDTLLGSRKLILRRNVWSYSRRLCRSPSIKYPDIIRPSIRNPMVHSGHHILG
jgi:hypothetical protein